MKTSRSDHGKQIQLVLTLAGSSLLASQPAAAYNEEGYSAEMERLNTLMHKEDVRFQAASIDLDARKAGILEKKAAIEQQEAALTTSIMGMDKLIQRAEFLFAGNDKDAPSASLGSFFQRPAALLRRRSPLPPLLEKVEQLHCAQTISQAKSQLDQLFDITAPGTEWPDEWLGKAKTTPQLHAGSMDIILATLKRTIERFPVLRKQAERVALQWDYCPLLEQGVLHDLKLSDRQLERVKAAPQAPLEWGGFRQWGFLGTAAERKQRFIPSLLDEITIAPYAYQIFLHQAHRKHCFPHPVTGEQYTETDAEKGPLRSFFPPPPDEPVGQYPYSWHPICEIPQVGFQAKPAWPKAILQKASAHLTSLQQEVEASKTDLDQLENTQQALKEKHLQNLLRIEEKISQLEEDLAHERLLAIEAAEAAAAEAEAAEAAAVEALAAEKRRKEEAERAEKAKAAAEAQAAEKQRKQEAERAEKAKAAAEAQKQQELAKAAERAEAKKQQQLAAKAAAIKAKQEKEKARKMAAAAAELEKQKKLANIAALKKKEAAEAAQLRKLEQARKAAALKKKLAGDAERKRMAEAQRQLKAATKQATLEKHNYTIMREPPKGMVVIPTPGGGNELPFVYVDDKSTPFKDKNAQAKGAASKFKISGTFSFNVPVNGSPPSLNSSITLTPAENVFLTGSASFKDGQLTYSWSGGYSNWRPGTISVQLNNWGPLKSGDGLALDKAVLNVGYKVDSDLLRDKKLSASLGLSAPLSGKKPTVSATLQWTPKDNWYFRTTVSQSLEGGSPNWNYGFGYSDWRPGTWRVEYSNYGQNKYPLDNLKNGTVTVSRGWSF